MGLLRNMVFCGSSRIGWMIEYLEGFPEQAQERLRSVTTIQRRKFERYDLIPVPVLEAMWHLLWLPGHKAPDHGMRILVLTEYLLKNMSYKNEQVKKNVKWLYETIVKEEMIGKRIFVKKEEFPTFIVKITLPNKPSVRAR